MVGQQRTARAATDRGGMDDDKAGIVIDDRRWCHGVKVQLAECLPCSCPTVAGGE